MPAPVARTALGAAIAAEPPMTGALRAPQHSYVPTPGSRCRMGRSSRGGVRATVRTTREGAGSTFADYAHDRVPGRCSRLSVRPATTGRRGRLPSLLRDSAPTPGAAVLHIYRQLVLRLPGAIRTCIRAMGRAVGTSAVPDQAVEAPPRGAARLRRPGTAASDAVRPASRSARCQSRTGVWPECKTVAAQPGQRMAPGSDSALPASSQDVAVDNHQRGLARSSRSVTPTPAQVGEPGGWLR